MRTLIAFWLDFQGLGAPGGFKKIGKRASKNDICLTCTQFVFALLKVTKKVSIWTPPRRTKTNKKHNNSRSTNRAKKGKEHSSHPGGVKSDIGSRVATLWRAGETSHSEKSVAKHWGKHTFGNLAETRAVGKGELLRGMGDALNSNY